MPEAAVDRVTRRQAQARAVGGGGKRHCAAADRASAITSSSGRTSMVGPTVPRPCGKTLARGCAIWSSSSRASSMPLSSTFRTCHRLRLDRCFGIAPAGMENAAAQGRDLDPDQTAKLAAVRPLGPVDFSFASVAKSLLFSCAMTALASSSVSTRMCGDLLARCGIVDIGVIGGLDRLVGQLFSCG